MIGLFSTMSLQVFGLITIEKNPKAEDLRSTLQLLARGICVVPYDGPLPSFEVSAVWARGLYKGYASVPIEGSMEFP